MKQCHFMKKPDRLELFGWLFAELVLEPFAFFRCEADIVVIRFGRASNQYQQVGGLVADVDEVAADRFGYADQIERLQYRLVLALVGPTNPESTLQAEEGVQSCESAHYATSACHRAGIRR